MSSLPGYKLEDFVQWEHDLVVMDERPDANVSLNIAEALGTIQPRPRLSVEQFKPILDLYEPYREQVEEKLFDFDEENQSWRQYASYGFDFIPSEVVDRAHELARGYST